MAGRSLAIPTVVIVLVVTALFAASLANPADRREQKWGQSGFWGLR